MGLFIWSATKHETLNIMYSCEITEKVLRQCVQNADGGHQILFKKWNKRAMMAVDRSPELD